MACSRNWTPVDPRHALVDEEQGDRLVGDTQLPQSFDGFFAGVRAQDAVLLAVLAAEVSRDRLQDLAVVIHGKNHRLGHIGFSS